MTTARQEFKELFARMKSVRYGNTIHVYTDSPEALKEVEKDIKRALENGRTLYHANGDREFITYDAIVDLSKPDADAYTWDKSGDRIKHNRVKHIVSKDGTHTQTITGTSYRNF